MDLKLIDEKGKPAATVAASDALFGREFNEALVHQVVVAYQANARLATRKQKARGEVNRSHRKPWRQKGTGRARVGSSRNPLWRHGGTTFGPQPRSYDHPMPKKKKRVAARRVLAAMMADSRVTVLDDLQVEPKTKSMRQLLSGLGLAERALVLVPEPDQNLLRASGNLKALKVVAPEAVNAYDLLKHRHLLATREALTRLQEVLAR